MLEIYIISYYMIGISNLVGSIDTFKNNLSLVGIVFVGAGRVKRILEDTTG